MKKSLRVVLAIFVILFWLMRLWSTEPVEPDPDDESDYYYTEQNACDEFIEDDTLSQAERARIIQRSWSAYQYDAYCARYGVRELMKRESEQYRNQLQLNWDGDFVKFWNTLYYGLYQHENGRLTFLQDSLQHIANTKNLSRSDFANLIVSFVQDIPYEFVMPDSCSGNETKPCNGNVLYGIYSPSEFVYQLKGDCDTRTVLLYTLLENLGFDAVIFNSRQYEHSMLGIDLPSTGEYIRHKGRNFYFWETTNVGWMQGVIPPGMKMTKYWKIVLD